MNPEFIQKLLESHQTKPEAPTTEEVNCWAMEIMSLLFPEVTDQRFTKEVDITHKIVLIETELKNLLKKIPSCPSPLIDTIVDQFSESMPVIYDKLLLDLIAFEEGDPAARSQYEVVRTYPGFFAIFMYRIAHQIHQSGVPLLPRILSECAHSKTGIDIHPCARIGDSFFIDHGTGVVIGETTVIGNFVKIYQGVTLGALSINKKLAGIKRHPTVGDHTVIYSGATILGGDTVIGSDCVIGGNVWLTVSVPSGTKVYHNADNKFVKKLNKSHHEEDH